MKPTGSRDMQPAEPMPQPAAPTRSKWNVNAKKVDEPTSAEAGKSGLLDDTIQDITGSAIKDNTAFGQ